MNIGEAINHGFAGGRIKATKKWMGTARTWLFWYDSQRRKWASQKTEEKVEPPSYESVFPGWCQTPLELEAWVFEDADPPPRFAVKTEVGESGVSIRVLDSKAYALVASIDEAAHLHEELGSAINCLFCGCRFSSSGACSGCDRRIEENH